MWPVHVKVKSKVVHIIIALETETREILRHYKITHFHSV